MFKTRSGILPTVNSGSNSGKHSFSALNDFSDDDEDAGAYVPSSSRGSSNIANEDKKKAEERLRAIDEQVKRMEESDESGMLANLKNQYKGNTQTKGGYHSDDNSVVSEQLSIGGGDNSGEESFSMND